MSDIVTISVSMPAEMQRLIFEQVKARFFGNISEYFRTLVRQDLERAGGPLAPAAPRPASAGASERQIPETPALPDPRLMTLSFLREASDADLVAWARELAKSPPESRRPLGRWLIAAERMKDELERRDLPAPPGHPLVSATPLKPSRDAPRTLNLSALGSGGEPTTTPANVVRLEDLRRIYPVEAIERLHKQSKPGTSERTNLAKLLRLLRGEHPKRGPQNLSTHIDRAFLDMLRSRYGLGEDPDTLGCAPVPRPTPPMPKSGSARAKPPSADEDA